MRDCVGGARKVCVALSQALYGRSSGLTGSDDAGSLSSPRATRACGLTVTDAERPPSSEARGCSVAAAERARGGGGGGSGDVAGGGTLVGGGGYLRDCVGGARAVCAALFSTLYGLSSGLMGSDDAGSLSSPRATRAGGLTVTDARSAYGGASSAGGGLMGNHIGSRSDLVSTAQHLLHAGAASLTRRPMRAVLVEPGRDVWPLFYCSGLKGSANTALLERPPSSEACSGSVAAAVGARGGGGGGSDDVAGGSTLVGGGGYLRDCVGVARTVCAALSPTLRGFSSGLTGSDDAGSLSSPRATRACGL